MVDLSNVVETVSEVVSGDRELAHEDRREETYPEPAALAVETTVADVTLIGEARSDVAVTLTVRADDPERLDDVRLRTLGDADRTLRLLVDDDSDGVVTLNRVEASVTVRVPADVPVESVETTAGSVTLRDLAVERVETDAGRVAVDGVTAETIETTAGRVEITESEIDAVKTTAGGVVAESSAVASITTEAGGVEMTDCAGDTAIETTAGEVEVTGLAGFLRAETTAGGITADADGIDGLATQQGSIDATLRAIRDDTTVTSRAGSVTLRVGDNVNADVELSSTAGGITADGFTHDETVVGGSARGTLGAGGSELTIETTMGAITLDRLDEQSNLSSEPAQQEETADTSTDGRDETDEAADESEVGDEGEVADGGEESDEGEVSDEPETMGAE